MNKPVPLIPSPPPKENQDVAHKWFITLVRNGRKKNANCVRITSQAYTNTHILSDL